MSYIKNSKGFTLIELMATLAILALIAIIAVPAVGNIIDNADASAEANSIAMIEKAGSLADIGGLAHDDSVYARYNVQTLIDEGYLDIDPSDGLVSATAYVERTGDGNTYEYYGGGAVTANPASDFEYMTVKEYAMSTGMSSEEVDARRADPEYQAMADNIMSKSSYDIMHELIVASNSDPLMAFDAALILQEGIYITGYIGESDNVVVPDSIDGLPVIGIGAKEGEVFDHTISSMTLPNSLLFIGEYSFYESRLDRLVIPDSVIFIGEWAFTHSVFGELVLGSGLKYVFEEPFYRTDVNDSSGQMTHMVVPDQLALLMTINYSVYENNPLVLYIGEGSDTHRLLQDFLGEPIDGVYDFSQLGGEPVRYVIR